jgi:pimeloyl-ACP methyl ester carboxylesterase
MTISKTLLTLLGLFIFNSVQASEYSFHVTVEGSGQPIILIPGLSSHGSVWNETVAKYKDNYQTYVVTLPGFAGVKPMDLSSGFLVPIKEELLNYIEDNNLNKPIVIGHSLGGFMAMLMAIDKPDGFDKIVLVDSAPFFSALQNPMATVETAKAMADMTRNQMQGQSKEMLSASLDMMLPAMILDKQNIEIAKNWGLNSDGPTVGLAMYELMTTDLRDKIAVIESPVMLLGAWVAYKNYGATHESVESNYSNQYSKVQDFQIHLTDVGQHFIMWDDAEFYFKNLNKFLK